MLATIAIAVRETLRNFLLAICVVVMLGICLLPIAMIAVALKAG